MLRMRDKKVIEVTYTRSQNATKPIIATNVAIPSTTIPTSSIIRLRVYQGPRLLPNHHTRPAVTVF